MFVNDSQLVLDYEDSFYNISDSTNILNELLKINFEQAITVVRGKTYKPFRQVAAFADEDLEYHFSGTSMKGQAWTPLMRKIKADVEKKTGHSFNYCMLNLYKNGNSSIGAHRDNESCLEPGIPIVSISFGATRNIVFQRKEYENFNLPLKSGSLLLIKPPTNNFWSHAIDKEEHVTEPRISLTFRKIVKKAQVEKEKRASNENEGNPAPQLKKVKTFSEQLPNEDWLEKFLRSNELLDDNTDSVSPNPPSSPTEINYVKYWTMDMERSGLY